MCLHPESPAASVSATANDEGGAPSLVLLHSHANRVRPLVRAIAGAIQSGRRADGNPGGGDERTAFVLTQTSVVDVSSPSREEEEEEEEEGYENGNGAGNGHGGMQMRCVPVVPSPHAASSTPGEGGAAADVDVDVDAAAISVEELAIVWFLSGAADESSGSSRSTLRVQTRLGNPVDIVQKPGRLVIFAAGLVHEAVLGGASGMQPCLVNRVKIYGSASPQN